MRCRPFALRGLASALGLWAALAAPAQAQAQVVTEYAFVPSVLAASSPAQVLFTARVPGPATRVYINLQPGQLGATTIVDLRDDGLGGDAVAGDCTFSVLLPRDAILTALRPDDVNVVFVGFLDVYDGATRLTRLNTFAPVYTPAVGDWPMVQFASTVRATTRVVNIVDATASPSGSLSAVLREFYRWFPDAYDFVNVVFDPSRPQNRFHVTIKNTVTGTGVGTIDASATYGSAGRLLGLNVFPTQNFFDGANAGYIHEISHQWIQLPERRAARPGHPSLAVSSMGGGVMGITIPGSGAGGTFACIATDDNGQVRLVPRPNGPVFNPLELYLMGLLPAVQVPERDRLRRPGRHPDHAVPGPDLRRGGHADAGAGRDQRRRTARAGRGRRAHALPHGDDPGHPHGPGFTRGDGALQRASGTSRGAGGDNRPRGLSEAAAQPVLRGHRRARHSRHAP